MKWTKNPPPPKKRHGRPYKPVPLSRSLVPAHIVAVINRFPSIPGDVSSKIIFRRWQIYEEIAALVREDDELEAALNTIDRLRKAKQSVQKSLGSPKKYRQAG